MQKFLLVLAVLVIIGIVARIAIGFFSANLVATGLVTTDSNTAALSGCDNLQNCTASTATTKRNKIAPLDYSVAASEVIEKFSRLIASQPGTQIVGQEANYLHATFKTTLLGYTDDLELLLDESTGILNVRSASRIGKSDLGANRKRIEALRAMAQDASI